MNAIERVKEKMHDIFDPEYYRKNSDSDRNAMWDLCLNYKIGKDDSVANHMGYDAFEPRIDPYSFQAFLYKYAVEPYFDPYNTLAGQETVDFAHIGDVLADKLTSAVTKIHELAEGEVNKNNRAEVDGKCREIIAARDVIDDVCYHMEHLTGTRDGSVLENKMFGLATDAYPAVRPYMIDANDRVRDVRKSVEGDLKKFAGKITPDRVYSFPEYQEEGTAKEIFTNVRNGYYDQNIDALKEFKTVFAQELMEHEAAYTEANIRYSEAVKADDKEAVNFFEFIMDIENEKAHAGGFKRGTVSMEEYEDITEGHNLMINASYDAARDMVTISVDEFGNDGLRRSGASEFDYDNIKDMTADEFKTTTGMVLYYAQEIERDEEERE